MRKLKLWQPVIALKTCTDILLIVLLVSACASAPEKGIPYNDFPVTEQLSGQTVPLDTAIFRFPYRIRVQGDTVAILDLHASEHFIQLFHYPDFSYIASLCRRGDSPEDMLSAENLRWDGNSLWTLDANKSQLTRYGLSLSGDSLLREEVVSLDKEILRALDFVVYDDSTFIVPDYSGESRFCWVNRKGKLLRKMGEIPSANEEALMQARPALAQAWRSFIDYNPRNGVLAAVTQLGEVLEIYNLKDSTHVVRIGPHGEPKFKVAEGYGIPTGIMGFCDVQVTDSAIYAVFQGRTFKEIAEATQRGDMTDGGWYVYVFSLEGMPLRKLLLEHYVHSVWLDEQKGIMITVDVNQDEPITKFHIN